MTMNRLFFSYMIGVGAAAGALLVRMPELSGFWLKPYFWILIAVALFDGAVLLRSKNAPGSMLTMDIRLIGFAIGIALMGGIPWLMGSPIKFF